MRFSQCMLGYAADQQFFGNLCFVFADDFQIGIRLLLHGNDLLR